MKKSFIILLIIFLSSIVLISNGCQSTNNAIKESKPEFYDKAISQFPEYDSKILKKSPEEYLTKEGIFSLILNQAINYYNQAVSNEDIDLLIQAGEMFYYVYANIGSNVAEMYLNKIREYKQKKIVEYTNIALKYEKNKDIITAASYWGKILKIDPNNKQAKEFFAKNNETIKKEIQKYLENAKKLLENQRFDEAEKLYKTVLLFDPKNVEAQNGIQKVKEEKEKAALNYFNKGKEAFEKKDYNSAQKFFKLALDLGYDKKAIKNYLDKIEIILNIEKYYQSCLDAYNKKEFFVAEDFAKKVINLDPNYKDIKDLYEKIKKGIEDTLLAWYNQAVELYNQKAYDKALELFQKIAKYNPNYKDIQNYIQMCNAKLQALSGSSSSGSSG